MGKPKVSVFVQISQLIVLVPSIIYSAQIGFQLLYIMRCLVSCELILVNLSVVYFVLHISPLHMFKNIVPEIGATIIMACTSLALRKVSSGAVSYTHLP